RRAGAAAAPPQRRRGARFPVTAAPDRRRRGRGRARAGRAVRRRAARSAAHWRRPGCPRAGEPVRPAYRLRELRGAHAGPRREAVARSRLPPALRAAAGPLSTDRGLRGGGYFRALNAAQVSTIALRTNWMRMG